MLHAVTGLVEFLLPDRMDLFATLLHGASAKAVSVSQAMCLCPRQACLAQNREIIRSHPAKMSHAVKGLSRALGIGAVMAG